MGLGNVGNLKPTDGVLPVPIEGPEIEDVLDILDGVDVTVDVDIIIIGVNGANQHGLVSHADTSALVDGTGFVGNDPLVDGPIVYVVDIGRLPRLGVNHSPDAAAIAVGMAVVADDSKISRGEVLHGRLYPRLDVETGIHAGHLLHLDGQSREHPRAVNRQQVLHAEAAVGGMEVGRIEQMVAQVTHEEPPGDVAVEGLGQERVASYFIHVQPPSVQGIH